MTCLPHKRFDVATVFEKRVANMTLTIEPLLVDGVRRGVPSGSWARLILIYLQIEAVKTRSRTVELGASMRNWLCRMGIPTGGKNYKDVTEQARRIEGSVVSFTWLGDDGTARWRDTIVRGRFEPLSEEGDIREGRLFVDTVELSETFYDALLRHPAPIHENALRHIANKSAVIDVYLRLAYRLHVLEKPVMVSWPALQAQFGSNYQRLAGFKPRFVEILGQALAVYPRRASRWARKTSFCTRHRRRSSGAGWPAERHRSQQSKRVVARRGSTNGVRRFLHVKPDLE
jgi:hypothetical protein